MKAPCLHINKSASIQLDASCASTLVGKMLLLWLWKRLRNEFWERPSGVICTSIAVHYLYSNSFVLLITSENTLSSSQAECRLERMLDPADRGRKSQQKRAPASAFRLLSRWWIWSRNARIVCNCDRKNITVHYDNPNNPTQRHMHKTQHNAIRLSKNNPLLMPNINKMNVISALLSLFLSPSMFVTSTFYFVMKRFCRWYLWNSTIHYVTALDKKHRGWWMKEEPGRVSQNVALRGIRLALFSFFLLSAKSSKRSMPTVPRNLCPTSFQLWHSAPRRCTNTVSGW